MANRFPLILDTGDSNKIKELPSGDNLDLTGNAISAVGNITSSGTTTTKDMKMLGYTTSERDALSPVNGQLIYNNTLNKFQGYQANSWNTFAGVDLTDLSVSTSAASGGGALSYNNNTGVFTFTPAATTAQTLSFAGTDLTLSGGNTVSLSTLSTPSNVVTSDSAVAAQPVRQYYGTQGSFPSATTWHGAIAHSHSDGAMYFAHGGSWNKLANYATTLAGYGITDAQSTLSSGTTIKTINGTSLLGSGNISVAGDTGSVTFTGTTIDTNDSSGIAITPAVTMASDLVVENDIRVSNVVYANRFESSDSGAPTVTSDSTINLSANDRVTINKSPLKFATFTTTERDALTSVVGDVIFNSTTTKLQVYNGSSWADLH